MKTVLRLAFVTAAVCLTAQAFAAAPTAPAPVDDARLAATLGVATAAAPTATPAATRSTWPPCQQYEGNACLWPGATRRCMWALYEPGICVCSGGIWVCG